MIINGKKIVLRPVEKEDYFLIFKWFNDKEVIDNIIGFRVNFPKEESLDWCEKAGKSNGKDVKWIIEISGKNPTPIGFVALYNIDPINKNAESGIVIGEKSFWGKGIGKEALTLSCDVGFKYLNLELIYAFILSSNKASLALYKKIGFKEEGILRKRVYRNGIWHNVISLSLSLEEWVI